MQLLFGTIGSAHDTEAVFQELNASSCLSTPALQTRHFRSSELSVGVVSRAFSMWQSPDQHIRLYLDGQIFRVHGQRQEHFGTTEEELAALAALYRRHGTNIWSYLDGSFCLIIEDGNTVHIGVDPLGVRTVYWWQTNGIFAFHTHLIDIASVFPDALHENHGAIGNYLATGSYPVAASPYREISQLAPGFAVVIEKGQAQVYEHYRMLCTNTRANDSMERMTGELTELISESVGDCIRAAKNPGILLSGGKDSRYITAEIVRQVSDPETVRTVTYGTSRDQENSDGAIAHTVATTLGVKNLWLVVNHDRQEETFARTIYLTSGADDSPITYPDHWLMHEELVKDHNIASLFRGDHCFGRGTLIVTRRGLLPSANLFHLLLDSPGYQSIIAADTLQTMAEQQADYLEQLLTDLRSETLSGRRDELYYGFRIRQVLSASSRLKHADLEVYNPLLSRKLLDWDQTIPDTFRNEKSLAVQGLKQQFPHLSNIPYATARLQGDWENRMHRDRKLIRFYRQCFETSGWIDRVGARAVLTHRLEELDAGAETAPLIAQRRSYQDRSGIKQKLRSTWIGRFVRELSLERKIACQTPEYLRIGRLAVVHGLMSQVETRRRNSRLEAATL